MHMPCNYCNGPLVRLGTLGTRDHVRCRSCGAYYSVDADNDADDFVDGQAEASE